MACILNNSFSRSFCFDNGTVLPENIFRIAPSLESIVFTPADVLFHLRCLNKSKTISPDGFSSDTLKILSNALVYPLVFLFEFLFSRQFVPECWKISLIKPHFKKGTRSSPENYRPIANTSVVCRLMERIILAQLTKFLTVNSLISPFQHGFHQGRSTVTNLLGSTSDWIFSCDSKSNVDIVFFNLSHAFDTITFAKLFVKLARVGIRGDLYGWLNNYVIGRKQSTVLDGVQSPYLSVQSGVPQGSVLGPILFSIFINDLPDYLISRNISQSVSLKLFADDIKSYQAVNTLEDAFEFQNVINTVINWCDYWQLKVNLSKCTVLHVGHSNKHFKYGINGIPIPSTPMVKDLGLLIDETLSFSSHIASIVSRARARCNIFLKSFLTRDLLVMRKFFVIYVRPLLEYCSPIWSPTSKSDVKHLESVLRYFSNLIPTCRFLPYKRRLVLLSLSSLQYRRTILDLVYLYSIITGETDLSLSGHLVFIPPSITRGHNLKIIPPQLHYTSSMRNFLSRTVPVWNALPISVLNVQSKSAFKSKLYSFLVDPCK